MTSYDEIEYPSYCYPATHPDNLATIARLFGLRSPPPERCRVLELGCASGGNLFPLAETFPESRLLGVDLSARQVEHGQRLGLEAGLDNVTLRHASITDLGEDLGTFDYVLCHGVYSWVPDGVQEKILQLCRRHLAPDGVAYVSYNTYPGWHMRGMLRETMCFHASRFTRPEEQVRQARMLLNFLSAAAPAETSYGILLRQESDLLRKQSDSYLFHEHLEEHNQPCYFFEFAQRAASCGLQYLGDASLPSMIVQNLAPDVHQTLLRLCASLVELEQYMDFVRNRTFRTTLLCRQEQTLSRQLSPAALRGLYLSAAARAVPPPTDSPSKGVEYRTATGVSVTSDSPLVGAVLALLTETWPGSLTCEEVVARLTRAGHASEDEAGRGVLEALLLKLVTMGVVEVSVAPARCALGVSERPVVSRLARVQAREGDWLATRRHTVYKLDELDRRLVPLLDGSHDLPALLDEVAGQVAGGSLRMVHEGQPILDRARAREVLATIVPARLAALARNGVLIG
jgi:methyltransferase-like protein/SAM-dependent methyltransferase